MDELENKLGSILSNPEMMKQIMSIAQNFGSQEQPQSSEPGPSKSGLPDIDMNTIQKLSALMGQSNVDKNQQNLLHALSPYLSHQRISKLERAMRAAKMAGMASTFFRSNQSNPSR